MLILAIGGQCPPYSSDGAADDFPASLLAVVNLAARLNRAVGELELEAGDQLACQEALHFGNWCLQGYPFFFKAVNFIELSPPTV